MAKLIQQQACRCLERIAYHILAVTSGALAASEAGGGIGQAIAGTYGIPMFERAGATHVTLRNECILLIGHLCKPIINTLNN